MLNHERPPRSASLQSHLGGACRCWRGSSGTPQASLLPATSPATRCRAEERPQLSHFPSTRALSLFALSSCRTAVVDFACRDQLLLRSLCASFSLGEAAQLPWEVISCFAGFSWGIKRVPCVHSSYFERGISPALGSVRTHQAIDQPHPQPDGSSLQLHHEDVAEVVGGRAAAGGLWRRVIIGGR